MRKIPSAPFNHALNRRFAGVESTLLPGRCMYTRIMRRISKKLNHNGHKKLLDT